MQLVPKTPRVKLVFCLSIAFAIAENVFDLLWTLGTEGKILFSNATLQTINALYFVSFCISSYR